MTNSKDFDGDFGDVRSVKWYNEYPKANDIIKHDKTDLEVMELKDEAKKCLNADTAAFNLKQSKINKSDLSWMKTLLSKGTVADKVAASIVMVQDNPKYNLSRLANLISMVKVSKKKQCTMIIDTLQELFSKDLLHPKYKLFSFEEQNFNMLTSDKLIADNPSKRRQLLAHWYFEDQLKSLYADYIEALNTVAHDTVEANKEKAINNMYKLLASNSEQEEKLLANIVNKIGDPSSKVASKAIFCLGQLLNEHPNMKQVVLNDIEKLLFRKNVTQKAQYYGICLLTQFVLDSESKEVANNLINVYFSFFKASLKKGEVDSRMMGALLMGVNRAFPFSEMDSKIVQEHVDTIYKVIHVASFNVSLNALSLLHQIVGGEGDAKQSNRFYCAMYKKLLDPQIGNTTYQAVFLSLLFKVLKKDTSNKRAKAFVKRILQVSFYLPNNMICAILYTVSQVFKARKRLANDLLIKKNQSKNIKIDDCIENFDGKEEEKVEDYEDTEKKEEENDSIILPNIKVIPTVNLIESIEDKEIDLKEEEEEEAKFYDPFNRNPLYSGADFSYCSELVVLSSHYHPTVSLFARTIIRGKPIHYTGDPLKDFTLIRFLDRYVFKNPKKFGEKTKFLSNRENPLAKRASYVAKGVKSLPVNSKSYLMENEDKIPADELFLYKYLNRGFGYSTKLKKDNRDVDDEGDEEADDDDLESVNSEEFNTMLDGLAKDKDFDDMDIAGEITSSKNKRKKEDDESDEESSDEDEENDDDDDDDDDELLERDEDDIADDFDDIEEEEEDDDIENIDDEDLSDMDFTDDEEEEDEKLTSSSLNRIMKKKKNNSEYDENIFAAAEEFAEILDQEGTAKIKHGGSGAVSNADKAAEKQIAWEDKRNRWIKGYNKTVGKSRTKNGGANKKGVKRFKKRY